MNGQWKIWKVILGGAALLVGYTVLIHQWLKFTERQEISRLEVLRHKENIEDESNINTGSGSTG